MFLYVSDTIQTHHSYQVGFKVKLLQVSVVSNYNWTAVIISFKTVHGMERILKPAKYKHEVNHVITQAHIHLCAYLHNNTPKYEYSQTFT